MSHASVLTSDSPRFRPAAPEPHTENLGFFRYMIAFGRNPIAAFGADSFEKPSIYVEALGFKSMLLSEPEAIKRMLLDNAANYIKSEQFLRVMRPALGQSILVTEGQEWRFQRRTTAPMFQMRSIATMEPAMRAAVEDMLKRWDRADEVDVAEEMMRLTYDIISRAMFSSDVSLPYEQMAAAFSVYLETLGKINLASLFVPPWVPTPDRMRGNRALAFLKREIGTFVMRRRAQLEADPASAPDDLLTLLLKARDPEGGQRFGDAEVFDNVMTFIFAGHETTANAMAWTFYLLSQFPEWDEKVATEAGATEEVAALETARMVIEETLRLYPPAPFITRSNVAADELAGQPIGPGTNVTVSPWVVHRHRLLWRDPDLFDPTRFAPGNREAIHRFAYLPFGAGPRICIGMAFAMQEAAIILSTVARRYRLTLAPDQIVEPFARVTLRPRYGLRMRLERR